MLLSEFSVQDQEVLQSNYIAVTIRYTQVVKVLLIFCMFWTYLYTTIIWCSKECISVQSIFIDRIF